MGNLSAPILPYFPLLTSHDVPTRIDASVSLLNTILPATEDKEDVRYTIKRLVNGLGSSNQASRQGFAVALTQLLSELPEAVAVTVLPLIVSTTETNARTDAQEERDAYLARLVGVQAVISSGFLFRTEKGLESLQECVGLVLALSNKKAWLLQPAYWVLYQALTALVAGTATPAWKDEFVAWFIQRLFLDPREKMRGWSPEKVAIVLVLQKNAVAYDYASIMTHVFPAPTHVLARANLHALSAILKGAAAQPTPVARGGPRAGSNAVRAKGGPSSAAASTTRPHFVWDVIFELYWGGAPAAEGLAPWADVWTVLVERALFDSPSTASKHTAFLLLIQALQSVPPSEVPGLFQAAAIRTLANNLRKTSENEKLLHKVAEKVVATLVGLSAADTPETSKALLAVTKAFTSAPHGSHAFDPKTIGRLVNCFDGRTSKAWIDHLIRIVIDTADEVDALKTKDDTSDLDGPYAAQKLTSTLRLWAFDQILHTTRHLVVSSTPQAHDALYATVLEFFAVLGWFHVTKSGKGAQSYTPNPDLSEPLQTAARSRFYSVVTLLTNSKPLAEAKWLARSVALIDNLSSDKKHFTPITEPKPELAPRVAAIRATYKKLGKQDEPRAAVARHLIDGVLLLSYDYDDLIPTHLESLEDCLSVLFDGTERSEGREGEDDSDADDADAPEPATVLVDLLLQLLHRSSAFVKTFARQVFLGFQKEVGAQALDLMLEQILPEIAAGGEGDDDAVDSAESDSAESESESDSESEAEIDADDVDDAFKNELLAALQASGMAVDENDDEEDTGESDSPEVLLDDEQMLELDDTLADIFRSRAGTGGARSTKLARLEDSHYRSRVVDLIEDFVKADASNPLKLVVLLPLVHILRSASPHVRELQQKARRIIDLITSKKDTGSVVVEDVADLVASIKQLLDMSVGAGDAGVVSRCAVYYTRFVPASSPADAADGPSYPAQVAQLFFENLKEYITQKNARTKIQPALTLDFVRRSPVVAQESFEDFLGLLDPTVPVNAFRYLQAFDVCKSLFSFYGALRTDASKARCLELAPQFRARVFDLCRNAIDAPAESLFDATRLKELLKMSLAVIRVTKVCTDDAEKVAEVWQPAEISAFMEAFKASERFRKATAIQQLLRQMVALTAVAEGGDKGGKKRKGGDEKVGGKKRK